MVGCDKPSEEPGKADESTRAVAKLEVDPSVLQLSLISDYNHCFESYPEILYLTQRDYPGAAHAAFKAAYQLAKTDGNFDFEVENLLRHAFYTSNEERKAWTDLTHEERVFLFPKLDDITLMDWVSVREQYLPK